jgi:hypothetical protein
VIRAEAIEGGVVKLRDYQSEIDGFDRLAARRGRAFAVTSLPAAPIHVGDSIPVQRHHHLAQRVLRGRPFPAPFLKLDAGDNRGAVEPLANFIPAVSGEPLTMTQAVNGACR